MDVYVTSHQHSRIVGGMFAKATGGELRSVHAIREGECATYGILRGADKVLRKGGPVWYIDHGYIKPGHYGGYYRVCLNGLHAKLSVPDPLRFANLGWEPEEHISPPDAPILVAPPSRYTAAFLGAESWVANVCAEIGRHTERRIILTDKLEAPGERLLKSAHCLVTLQSNLAVEAIRQGVPVFIARGNMPYGYWHPAQEFSKSLEDIEKPLYASLSARKEWGAKIAAVQFRLDEMGEGLKKHFNQGV